MSGFINKPKKDELAARMAKLGISEQNLTEKFILGSGSGGQKLNKTASCVYLKHTPSGMEIKCQKTRSRELNRFFARRELCDKLEHKIYGEKSRIQQEIEKIRRKKRRRTRRQKERMLAEKRMQSDKKRLRGRVDLNHD